MSTHKRWYTRYPRKFYNALEPAYLQEFPAGSEVAPLDATTNPTWVLRNDVIWEAVIRMDDILQVTIYPDAPSQIMWQDGSTTHQFGIVALALELQNHE